MVMDLQNNPVASGLLDDHRQDGPDAARDTQNQQDMEEGNGQREMPQGGNSP